MTQNLKIEVLTGDISIDGMVVTNLVTKEELSTAIVKKADLGTDGKIPTSQLPAEIVNTAGIVDEVKLQLETSIKDAVDESNAYAESYTDNALSSKADLASGKVPLEQLPAIDQYPQFGTALSNLSTSILSAMKQRTDQLEKTKADLGEDGKVLREQIPSYEKISGLPEQLEVMSTQTAAISEELGAHKLQTADQIVALKENINSNSEFLIETMDERLEGYADKDAVKRGIANRYDSLLTYNSGERVVLVNGDIVKSTIDGNTNDPSVDKTGWVLVDKKTAYLSAQELASASLDDGDTVLLSGYERGSILGGGIFKLDRNSTASPDGGLIISAVGGGNFFRSVGVSVSLEDFGFKETMTPAAQTAILKSLLESPLVKEVYLGPYTISLKNVRILANNKRIIGVGTTIKLVEDMTLAPFVLTNCELMGITFDGQNFTSGSNDPTYGSIGFSVVIGTGDFFKQTNCVFKNLLGKENGFQYGSGVTASTMSSVELCKYNNIRTATNTANTGGFCGGHFIFLPAGWTPKVTTHLVSECVFEDIYTVANAASQIYHDSDGVRSYFTDYGSSTSYDNVVKSITIKVDNCSFYNVLKSSCKLQHAKVVISNCYSKVDNLRDQPWVYTGFRYQRGDDITIENCRIEGMYRFGIYISGKRSVISNCTINLVKHPAAIKQSLVQLGELNDINDSCLISGLYTANTGAEIGGLFALGCSRIKVDNSTLCGSMCYGNVPYVEINNSKLESIIDNRDLTNYSPSIGKVKLNNCEINSVAGELGVNLISQTNIELFMKNCTVTGIACLNYYTHPYAKLVLEGCSFDLTMSSTNANRRFIYTPPTLTLLKIKDCYITDSRVDTPDAYFVTQSTNTEVFIDGLNIIGNASSKVIRVFYLSPCKLNPIIKNVVVKDLPANSNFLHAVNSNLRLENIYLDYVGATCTYNCTAGTSFVILDGIYGNIATPFLTTSGAGVTKKYERLAGNSSLV